MWRRVKGSRFLRDSAVLQVSQAGIAVSQLLSSVVVATYLGPSLQGEFFTAVSLFGFGFMLLAIGVVQATVSQLAQTISKGQTDKAAAWLAFLVKSYALVGLVTVGAGYFFFPWLGVVITKDPAVGHTIGVWAWWLAFTPLLELPRVVAVATFQGARRMADLGRLDFGTELARLVFVSVGAYWTRDPVGPVLGTLAASVAGSIWGTVLYRRMSHGVGHKLPGPREILSRVRDVPLREGLRLGFRIGALRSMDAITLNTLPPLLIQFASKLAGHAEASPWVAYFRIAQRFLQVPVMALAAFSKTALPALGAIAARRQAAAFRTAFLRVTVLSGVGMAAAVGVTYLVLPYVVPLIYKNEYPDPIVRVAGVLAFGFAFQGFSVAFDSFYIYTQQLRAAFTISVVGTAVAAPGMFALAYFLPETGAAWGIVLCYGWIAVHLVFIALFFRGGGHHRVFAPPSAAPSAAPFAATTSGPATGPATGPSAGSTTGPRANLLP